MSEQNYEEVGKIENEFYGYSLFTEVENEILRAFNRAVMSSNILEDAGYAIASEYLSQFSDRDKGVIMAVLAYMKTNGIEKTRKDINANVLGFELKGNGNVAV